MADTVKRTVPIWVFGTKTDFKIYDCGVALDPFQYVAAGRQKNQICLHFTAGNGPGKGTVEWWNTEATQFFCPNWPTHDFQSPNPGTCPLGHGTLRRMNASAHYVVERAKDRADAGRAYVDVVEVVESEYVTWHGESVNTNSIGIEHANVGPDFTLTNDDTFTGAGANKRPTDGNHWLSMPHYAYSGSNLSSHAFQAYQEEQYLAMILLLRYLCIKHRIARRFLGDTTAEKFARWHNRGALIRSRLMRFRGIFAHMNCHNTKECGGPALHRNRLFRGIIDEWWLPIEVEGTEREYYMGPFDPQPNTPSFYRWTGGALTAALFRDCNVDALQETKSYFLLDRVDWYYAQTEIMTVGGFFPIGTNRIWHGGVHFQPPDANHKIYAACSGTIVAARLGSDAALETDKEYGSQRFVLIRHCVYWRQEPDPGGGQRLNYDVHTDPTYFFTLYMHLAHVAKIDGVDDNNPPWFNYWLRRNAGGNANPVFCPNVPVSVGDWIGDCGVYRTQRMLHFEVLSKQEMTDPPWNDPAYRIYDTDSNAICDVPALNRFVLDRLGDGIDTLDILRAAKDLRKIKTYHKSEWALADASSLEPVLPDAAARNAKWEKIKKFMWVADAVAACPDLSTQLCTATGIMWHYHPVTFMEYVNRLILRENGQVSEPDFRDTNVEMEDGFLTHYVNFSSGSAVPAAADPVAVKPFSVSDNTFDYHFSRKELACLFPATAASPHAPADDPPKQTKFHLALLDVIEDVRETFANSLDVKLSYVCGAHITAANAAFCEMQTPAGLAAHAAGMAIDITPSSRTQASVRKFWKDVKDAAGRFKNSCSDYSSSPSHGELQGDVQSVAVVTDPTVSQKLDAGTALTAPQVNNFVVHLELVEKVKKVRWVVIVSDGTMATAAVLDPVTGNIVGTFASKATAERERESVLAGPWAAGNVWQSFVKTRSRAFGVEMRGPNQNGYQSTVIVGYYNSVADAEAERSEICLANWSPVFPPPPPSPTPLNASHAWPEEYWD